jgi:hypothetical protein
MREALGRVTKQNIGDYFSTSISNMAKPTDYTLKWDIFTNDAGKRMFLIHLNFTKQVKDVPLTVTLEKLHWSIDQDSNKSELSFREEPLVLAVSGTPPIKASVIKST